jgi:hypothetical protein
VQRVEDVACTVCGCVCDDLRITLDRGRVVQADGACRLAEPWFLGQGREKPAVAQVEGQPVSLEAALDPEPTPKDLEDPDFLRHVEERSGGEKIEPDPQDFDMNAPVRTNAEAAEQYRLAQASKLIRLWREWRAGLQ